MNASSKNRTGGLAGLVALLFFLVGPLAHAGVGPTPILPNDDWTTSPRQAGPSATGPGYVFELDPSAVPTILEKLEGRGTMRLESTRDGTVQLTLYGSFRMALERRVFDGGVLGVAYEGRRGTGALRVLGDRVFLYQR